jgi:hypothetical protein
LASMTLDQVQGEVNKDRIRDLIYTLCSYYPYKKIREYCARPVDATYEEYTVFVTWEECFEVKYDDLHSIFMYDFYRINDLRVDQRNNHTSIAMEVKDANKPPYRRCASGAVMHLREPDPSPLKKRKGVD